MKRSSNGGFIRIERPPYLISTDPALLDLDTVTEFLARSYWAEGIPPDVVARAVRGSLCFGLYNENSQIGFARVVTDGATYAYLCDVFVVKSHQGKGLARWLMETVMAHKDLQGLRRISLVTRDAHGLYEKFGFSRLSAPDGHMEILQPGIYLKAEGDRAHPHRRRK